MSEVKKKSKPSPKKKTYRHRIVTGQEVEVPVGFNVVTRGLVKSGDRAVNPENSELTVMDQIFLDSVFGSLRVESFFCVVRRADSTE